VEEPRGLLRDRLDDRRMRVAGVDHADTACKVDEHVAVDVGDRRVLRPRRKDRQVDEQRPRHDPCLALRERARPRSGDLGSDLDRPCGGHDVSVSETPERIPT
jgi:hypothetical protein